jgi:hypothetical protein
MSQTENEIILESKLEQAKNRENDHKNCANCSKYRKCHIKNPDPCRVCSIHTWNEIERMERSYD